MAARSKKTTENTTAETTPTHAESTNNNSDKQSQMATILVGLLIIASGLLIYNYFQRASAPEVTNQNQQEQTETENKADDQDKSEENEEKEGQYTVMPGDSLWTIAEKVYGDGFQWKKIADANKLENNAYGEPTVSVGQVLNMPDSAATDKSPVADAGDEAKDKDQSKNENQGSTGDKSVAGVNDLRETPSTAITTHTVQAGETLWSIAEHYYADGDQWELIYNSPLNSIGSMSNGQPLLHSGNVIVIPDMAQ